jgi:hypothetical protein
MIARPIPGVQPWWKRPPPEDWQQLPGWFRTVPTLTLPHHQRVSGRRAHKSGRPVSVSAGVRMEHGLF